ncbi:MAG: hypothetical protein ACXACI_07530 [Candidatus Hodarchaeales archaeon]
MPDILFIVDAAMKLLLGAAFFVLFTIQVYPMRERPLKTNFFPIAMLAGCIASAILLIETILWELNPIEENRTAFHLFALIFLQLYAYFWYLHYESNINFAVPKWGNVTFLSLITLNLMIASLYFVETSFEILPASSEFWSFLGVSGDQGRIVTIIGQLTIFTWVPICGVVLNRVYRNNLVELKKITPAEFLSIMIQLIAATMVLLGNLLVALRIDDDVVSSLLIIPGILLLFIGVLSLNLSYLLFKPPHIQSPPIPPIQPSPIRPDHYEKLLSAFADKKGKLKAQIEEYASAPVTDLMPKKLPSTALFILIHILNSEGSSSYAKSIEADLGLGKSTVSYNLSLLEEESLVERKTELLGDDHRLKAITISKKGFEYLFTFYLKLEPHFKPSEKVSKRFMKKYVEGLFDEAVNILFDTFPPAEKPAHRETMGEIGQRVGISTRPTRKLSTGEIVFLPHHIQPTAIAIVTLLEGTVEEVAEESNIDPDRTLKNLNALRERGYLGVKVKGGKTIYTCQS